MSENIVALDQENHGLVAVINGSAAQPFNPATDLALLPAGGGVVVADASTWCARDAFEASSYPWATTGELDAFLVGLHLAGYEARALHARRTKKVAKVPQGRRPDPALIADHVHTAVATRSGGKLWCGTCDTHDTFTEGCLVRATNDPAGTGAPVFTATSKFHRDTHSLVAFDWSLKGVHATRDGRTVERFADIDSLVASLSEPTKLAAETTFESWDPLRRAAVLADLRRRGHELYVYRPLHTARRRPAALRKTDENDALIIHHLASNGRFHFYPAPTEPNVHWVRRRTRANNEYRRVRLDGGKVRLAAKVAELLGDIADLDPQLALVVRGTGAGGYSTTLLAAVHFATTRSRSRDEFERLLGLFGSAYPTLLRSEVHTHAWRYAADRGATWLQFRSAIRELRQLLLEDGTTPVDEGSVLPTPTEVAAALADAGFPVTMDAAALASRAIASQST